MRSIHARQLRRLVGVLASTAAFLGGLVPAATAGESHSVAQAFAVRSLYVAPDGTGVTCTRGKPCALTTAHQLVRGLAPTATQDIDVVLAGGKYSLDAPLAFDARDSGQNGHTISWTAAPGAEPTLSGGTRITGWKPSPGSTTVWQAQVPRNLSVDPRQLYVDGALATRARTRISPSDVSYSANGVDIKNTALAYLNGIGQQNRVEMEFVNSFTDRFSPVVSIANSHVTMAQPAWNNNTWGYDTVQTPFRTASVYLENAREFLDSPGEWYLDTTTHTLYYQPPAGQRLSKSDVELPRLESLLQVSGTYTNPVHDLTFSGIRFADTTWTGPNSQGYADQQTGAFQADASPLRPADAFTSCSVGCQTFESTRNQWHQTPAAVQVSAANHITLTDNTYSDLGSLAVGVGQDADANASGVGLGASDITVSDSTFADTAGGGIVVGGIQPDAHHPSNPAMTNRDILVSGNVIHDVSQQYQDQDGILFTYVTRATVRHNEVYDTPYSGIGSGWGWGIQDPGGSPDYIARGTYDYQPVYQTPTTAAADVVSGNYIHDVMQTMNDGAGFYNLSASPGSVFEQNYIRDTSQTGTYFDEGSRYWTVDRNVLDVQTPDAENASANNNTGNMTYTDNWIFNGQIVLKRLDASSGTTVLSHGLPLPLAAARVVYDSGVPAARRNVPDSNRPPLAVVLASAQRGSAPPTVTATLTNLDAFRKVTGLTAAATVPAGWTAKLKSKTVKKIAAGGTATVTWTVTGPSGGGPIDAITVGTAFGYTFRGTAFSSSAPIALVTGTPVTSMSTFGSVPSVFGQVGGVFAIRNAGADIWGAGGQSDDAYGAIYTPKGAGDGSVVTVRVDSEDAVNPWTKAGLVLRNDVTQPRSSAGYVALVVTPGNGVNLDWDSNGDGLLDQYSSVSGVNAPVWLRLTRTGTQATAAYSTDGTVWKPVGGPVTLTGVAARQDVGMIYTSHDANVAGQASFSNFTVN